MKVQILGTGCPKCRKLYEAALEAVRSSGKNYEVVKIESIDEITSFGVMMTPALAIDGEVKCSGKILNVEEIKKLLK